MSSLLYILYGLAAVTGAWATWQDLKQKAIDGRVIALLFLTIILGIYVHGWAGFKALAIALILGWAIQFGLGWQLGDTLLLTMFAVVTLHPFAIAVATVSTSFFFALAEAKEKGKGATIPYAPFLFLGALLAWTML